MHSAYDRLSTNATNHIPCEEPVSTNHEKQIVRIDLTSAQQEQVKTVTGREGAAMEWLARYLGE